MSFDPNDDLVGLESHKRTPLSHQRDYTDADLPTYATDAANAPSDQSPASKPRFNWLSFWTMLASIGVVVFLVIFIPGPFDEIAAAIALSAINAFIANYRK